MVIPIPARRGSQGTHPLPQGATTIGGFNPFGHTAGHTVDFK